MLNCPECGLTITDAQKECPKCRTKVEDMKIDSDSGAVASKKQPKKKNLKSPPVNTVKDEMIEAVIQAEEAINESDPSPEEELIAAVVEAEALAAIEEEKKEEKNLCSICQTPLLENQEKCDACGASALTVEQEVKTKTVKKINLPKINVKANQWAAITGYVLFFFPFISGFSKESSFSKFHAKQALNLFISSLVLFLGLILLRNTLNDWFYIDLIDLCDPSDLLCIQLHSSWHNGHGIPAGIFYHYLSWMIISLHLLPFAWMLIGIINVLLGEKRPLPLIGHFVKDDPQEYEQLNLFE